MGETITITIQTGQTGTPTAAVVNEVQSETLVTVPKKRNKKHHSRNHIHVYDMELLYKISDAKLLDKLHGTNVVDDKTHYFFTPDEDIQKIVNEFNASKEVDVECQVAED